VPSRFQAGADSRPVHRSQGAGGRACVVEGEERVGVEGERGGLEGGGECGSGRFVSAAQHLLLSAGSGVGWGEDAQSIEATVRGESVVVGAAMVEAGVGGADRVEPASAVDLE
jgi:hypothetical protein